MGGGLDLEKWGGTKAYGFVHHVDDWSATLDHSVHLNSAVESEFFGAEGNFEALCTRQKLCAYVAAFLNFLKEVYSNCIECQTVYIPYEHLQCLHRQIYELTMDCPQLRLGVECKISVDWFSTVYQEIVFHTQWMEPWP